MLDGDQMDRVLRGETLGPVPPPEATGEAAEAPVAGKEPTKTGAPPLESFGAPEPRPA